jgi:anion-transporting  ArsA/GET3 family ATPase
MLNELLRRRVIAVIGKGGVGRSSTSAAIAAIAASRGMRALVMESDARTPVAAMYGKRPGFAPIELAPHLWGMFLGGQESLEDYLGLVVPHPILRAVFASSLYQYFVQAAPAVRELTAMGKVYHEIARRPKSLPPWDLIVFDTPASGQALSMIRMPFVARETFGASMVGREADSVANFFRDASLCAMVAVTTAETLAMAETLEVNRVLRKIEIGLAAVVFNRMSAADFESADIMRMKRRAVRAGAPSYLDDLAEVARDELRRRNRERRARGIIQRQIERPVIDVRERRWLSGLVLVAEIQRDLTVATTAGEAEKSGGTASADESHPSRE